MKREYVILFYFEEKTIRFEKIKNRVMAFPYWF
jgi:hypothetical protein